MKEPYYQLVLDWNINNVQTIIGIVDVLMHRILP